MTIRETELFRDFTDDQFRRFGAIMRELRLKKGEALFEENDPGDALFIVHTGAVRVFKRLDREKGTEKSLALLESGACLGEMTILDGAPRSASARAELDASIYRIGRGEFLSLLKSDPDSALRLFLSFMKVIGERLRRTNEELVALYEVGRIISAAPPLNVLLKSILARLMSLVGSKFGAVLALNDIAGMLEVAEAQGEGFDAVLGLKTGADEGLAGAALARKKTLRIAGLSTSPEFGNSPRFGYERENMLIVPLARGDKPIGVILLADRGDGQPFDPANENLLQAVASQAAAAVESALFHKDAAAREQFDRVYFHF
ncbi:MAG: cyclic nucleotide-binding domain-containing protein [bacterium]